MQKVFILAILSAFLMVAPASAATKKTAKKTTGIDFSRSSFSAKAAAKAKTTTGAKPPAGYMEALDKAQRDFNKAFKAARGNKAKIKAASDAYDAALAEAMKLLN